MLRPTADFFACYNYHCFYFVLRILHEDDFLLLKGIINDDSDKCIVSFTGVGHAMGGLDVQKEEFVGSALRNGSVFFVTDKTRSWSNKICEDKLIEVFSRFGSFENIVAIGNSMGGTNALLMGPKLGCQTIIVFAPQFSVHPEVFPDLKNKKLMEYRDAIDKWVFKSVDDSGPNYSSVSEYIFHGGNSLELMHARKFSKKKNRVHLILKDCDHHVAKFLKKKGVLSSLIGKCIEGASRDQIIDLIPDVGIFTAD